MRSREEIEKQVDEFTLKYIGKDFEFREYQKEKIIDIIENIVSTHKNHNHVIEAPTGSGKSIIIAISSGVLWNYYRMKSYILCSDLFLFDQYVDFFNDHPDFGYGYIKGQLGNYICMLNGEDIQNADCKVSQISFANLFNEEKATALGYECAKHCQYIQLRKKAVNAPVTLMTYQLYLMYTHYGTGEEEAQVKTKFTPRQVIFCDECHNLPNIIKDRFTVSMKLSDFDKMNTVYNMAYAKSMGIFDEKTYDLINHYTIESLNDKLDDLYAKFINIENDKKLDFDIMGEYYKLWLEFREPVNEFKDELTQKKKKRGTLNTDEMKTYKMLNSVLNKIAEWEDYYLNINNENVGIDYFIKKIEKDAKNQPYVVCNCAKEDWLIFKYILASCDYKVMLSATVGGKISFDENCGIKYTDEKESMFERIPSTFDFSKSPVFFLNRYKMSYKEREKNLPEIQKIVYNICNKFKDKKGIIQTGSYEIAQQIIFSSPYDIQKRFLYYNGSKEKTNAINTHKQSENTILIGPTLVEGIDLPDDDCRFIIILKMPYPNIKDAYVETKIRMFPTWYTSNTSNAIIQGIGRGIRNENDYCTTYILDACFYSLYLNTKDQYSKELQDRIKIYK